MKPQGAKQIELTRLAVFSVVAGSSARLASGLEVACRLGETVAVRIHCRYTPRRPVFPSEPCGVAQLRLVTYRAGRLS